MHTTSVRALPVWPFHSPERTSRLLARLLDVLGRYIVNDPVVFIIIISYFSGTYNHGIWVS